jgi:hypothetical protein
VDVRRQPTRRILTRSVLREKFGVEALACWKRVSWATAPACAF